MQYHGFLWVHRAAHDRDRACGSISRQPGRTCPVGAAGNSTVLLQNWHRWHGAWSTAMHDVMDKYQQWFVDKQDKQMTVSAPQAAELNDMYEEKTKEAPAGEYADAAGLTEMEHTHLRKRLTLSAGAAALERRRSRCCGAGTAQGAYFAQPTAQCLAHARGKISTHRL